MDEATSSDRRVARYVGILAALAMASIALAAFLQVREGIPAPTWQNVTLSVAFVAAFFVLSQTSFTFTWRGQRHRMVLDEVALYVGLLALPLGLIVYFVAASSLLEQARMRRERRKAVFNFAQNVLASSAAIVVALALQAVGVEPVLAALPAAILYPLATDFLLAGIFARITATGHLALFRDRFLSPSLLAGSVGAGGGVAVATLWSVHPLTLLSLGPFVFLTYRYGVLAASADRELEVHKRLAEVSQDLVGTTDLQEAARAILRACGDMFPSAGRAELALDNGVSIFEDFDDGADTVTDPLTATVPGNKRVSAKADGSPIGVLRIHARRAANPMTEVERALARVVAAQLGAAIEEVRAVEQSVAQREILARQEKLSALGTLVAGVAHEINNPVTYMRGALELAKLDLDDVGSAATGDPKEAEAAVQHARASLQKLAQGVDRVERITHALKAVARQGNGERAPEDVSAIVEDVVQVVRVGLPQGVTLATEVAPHLPLVRANASELHQVLLNLVKNAAEVLGPSGGGDIHVHALAADGHVIVQVRDNGPGIPADVQRRLFEPFFTTKRNGTGLGLSLSRGIVEAHGGELLLDSAVGRGTTFTMRLPATID